MRFARAVSPAETAARREASTRLTASWIASAARRAASSPRRRSSLAKASTSSRLRRSISRSAPCRRRVGRLELPRPVGEALRFPIEDRALLLEALEQGFGLGLLVEIRELASATTDAGKPEALRHLEGQAAAGHAVARR